MTYSSDRTPKLRITKVYFSMVTVIKVDDGVHIRYYSSTVPGEIHPVLEVIETEADWQRTLAEAEAKGVRVEVEEFPLMGEEKLPELEREEEIPTLWVTETGRRFPRGTAEWIDLGETIKTTDTSPETAATVNGHLDTIIFETGDIDAAKRWLVEKAGELGIQ